MNFFDESTLKKILYTFLSVLVVAVITVFSIYIWYGNETNNNSEEYSLETKEYDYQDETKEASSTNDKNISAVNNLNSEVSNYTSKNQKINLTNNNLISSNENTISASPKSKEEKNDNVKKENIEEKVKEEKNVKKELKFLAPVDGEIIKDFASETLIYSKTLDEWTTHLGIDIKGAKTSIVKSAEDGVVESIKNDPRYGLTITISHQDGFKTVYSNLLTTEFVKEGDKVSKGDTIATIGETASFEVLDEPHLHFEMYKDEVAVNPTVYLK